MNNNQINSDEIFFKIKTSPLSIICNKENLALLNKWLSILEEKERFVVIFRYGLYEDGEPLTLKKIAAIFKLTPEKYDDNYLALRFNTGLTHLNVNIPFNVFMGSYSYFLSLVIYFIKDELPKRGFSHKEILNIINSIQKIINLDITLVIRAYYSKEISEKEKLSDDFIKRLSRIAEFRDEDTGAHIERMSHYCMTIAEHLGFDYDFQMDILEASPMHDIGKISIPDHILLKPSKLTDGEFEIMKTHTVKGYEILGGSDSKIMKFGAEIALSHHERYDGYGYPDRLKGEDIPISGRICIISDVFDALTNKRIYKPAYSVEESMNIMKNEMGVGKYFDPAVFDAFIKGFDDIMTIKKHYAR